MNRDKIANIRREYGLESLLTSKVSPCPFVQFKHWLDEAIAADFHDANAMVLSTVNPQGKPSSRIVLLKGLTDQGFRFFTNYESQKGQELLANPAASLVFWWDKLERQVRIEGEVRKLTPSESELYFHSRPRGSQIGAWSSPQSQTIGSPQQLQDLYQKLEDKFQGQDIPLPPHWGGYLLVPDRIEFWQGQPSRLHDRVNYTLNESAEWVISRLAP
ncbi:MAG: pyridoxamine 5'-phosphate oxidase [Lentisphaeria bacterium]|nr:pyridoxamine 5'-phosphate oxidase [Lentisphaeria bacterium]